MDGTDDTDGKTDGPDEEVDDIDEDADAVCAEAGCGEPVAVRLHVPWAGTRDVCAGHGRALVKREGVVAEPLAGVEGEWHETRW